MNLIAGLLRVPLQSFRLLRCDQLDPGADPDQQRRDAPVGPFSAALCSTTQSFQSHAVSKTTFF